MSVVFVKCYFYVDVSNCRWEEREAFLIFKIFISFLLSAFVFSTGLTIVISYSLKNTQKYIYSSSHLFSLLHLSTNSCWQQSRWREVFFFCFLQAEETEKERKEGLERRPVFCLKKQAYFDMEDKWHPWEQRLMQSALLLLAGVKMEGEDGNLKK